MTEYQHTFSRHRSVFNICRPVASESEITARYNASSFNAFSPLSHQNNAKKIMMNMLYTSISSWALVALWIQLLCRRAAALIRWSIKVMYEMSGMLGGCVRSLFSEVLRSSAGFDTLWFEGVLVMCLYPRLPGDMCVCVCPCPSELPGEVVC